MTIPETALADSGNIATEGTEQLKKTEKSVSLTAKKTTLNGLVSAKSGLHYYKNGKKVKSTWQKVGRKKYYFDKKGKAVIGIRKISGNYYLFNKSGSLHRAKKTKFVEVNNAKYCVAKSGQVLTDWQLVNDKLYHFSKKGKMEKSKTVDKVRLNKYGVAKSSYATKAKIEALKAVNKTSSPHMSKSKRLRAAWNYITSKRNFRYRGIYPDMSKPDWQYRTAYQMLKGRAGNCYSFACAFAAMAQVIGYEPKIALGRVHGSRDGAADGFTRHAWVKIDGGHYDPEIKYANNYVIYGSPYYTMIHKNARFRKF